MADSWITYRTRFLVKARQLTTSLTFIDTLGRQHSGHKGDYLAEFCDGVLRIISREFFEDVYVPMFPNHPLNDHRMNDCEINGRRLNDRAMDDRRLSQRRLNDREVNDREINDREINDRPRNDRRNNDRRNDDRRNDGRRLSDRRINHAHINDGARKNHRPAPSNYSLSKPLNLLHHRETLQAPIGGLHRPS